MSVYKRDGVYWYDSWFRGQRIRESTGLSNKSAAEIAESIRKAGLAEGRVGIARREPCPKFEDFVTNDFLPWSEKQHVAHPRTHMRYKTSSHPLNASFGKLPLDAIGTTHVEKFKQVRSDDVSTAATNRDVVAHSGHARRWRRWTSRPSRNFWGTPKFQPCFVTFIPRRSTSRWPYRSSNGPITGGRAWGRKAKGVPTKVPAATGKLRGQGL